jgi:hypothetical protein
MRRFVRRQIDNTLLEMALVGFNAKRDEIVEKIAARRCMTLVRA